MDDASFDVDVQDNREIRRYEASGRDATATLGYRPECRLVLAQMHVPLSLEGPGHRVGAQLLLAAIARAKAENLTLVPSLPFARRWLRDNPEAWVGVTVDWSTGANADTSPAAPHSTPTVSEPLSAKRAISWHVDPGESAAGDRLEVSVTYSQTCPQCGDGFAGGERAL